MTGNYFNEMRARLQPQAQSGGYEQQGYLAQMTGRLAEQDRRTPRTVAAQENEEYGPLWKTLDGVMLVLQEAQRPQKALFAGFNAWQRGASVGDALGVIGDEFTWGAGSGNFRRDVSGIDLIDPDGNMSRELWSAGGVAGLALDIIADPINLIPFAKVGQGVSFLGRGATGFIGRNAGKIPIVGKQADAVVSAIAKQVDPALATARRSLFVRPRAQSQAGKAAEQAGVRIESFAAEHSAELLDDFTHDTKAWNTLVTESGKTSEELEKVIIDSARGLKANDAQLLPEALNDTFARIYRDYGIDAFDDFMKHSGRRILTDEAPLRRAILTAKWDDTNKALRNMLGDDVSDDIRNIVVEMKERDLERFVFEQTQTVSHTKIPNPVVESMERDYLMVAATPHFREVVEHLGSGGKAQSGFGYTPFHTSELHSQIQDIGINKANELIQTPMKNPVYDGASEFVLTHPRTGEKMHLPVMTDPAFHTDPRLIDTVREHYTRRAVETSQVLDDLVRGYGKVLDNTIELRGQVDRLGNPIRVNTFGDPIQVVKPQNVSKAGGGALQAAPGTALIEEIPNYRLSKPAALELERRGLKILEGVKGFENVALPAEAADIVMKRGRWEAGFKNDFGPVGEVFNTLQNRIWKPATLFFFPGYYARNTVTNVMLQNMLGMPMQSIPGFTGRGVKILSSGSHGDRYRRVADSVKGVAGGKVNSRKVFERIVSDPTLAEAGETLASKAIKLKDLVDGVSLNDLPGKDDLAMLQLLTELGIVRSGQYGLGEVTRTLEVAAANAAKSPGRRLVGMSVDTSSILSAGAESAQFLEDSQRVGAFLWAIEKGGPKGTGMPILEARDMILRGMVDFNNLTDFERNVVRKYGMPFYSWARNSTPLVMESFVQDNNKWRALNKTVQAQEKAMVETEGTLSDRLIPEYVARGINVPVARGEDGDYRYYLFDGWIPQSQLTDIDTIDELKKFVPENLGPIPKTVLELMFGESIFLEKDFAEGQRTYMGRRLSEQTITVLRNIRLLNTVDSLMKSEDSGQLGERLVRFFTGLNTVRVSKERAVMGYTAKVNEYRREITANIMEAAREGHHEEIPGLVAELKELIQRGR